MKSLRKHPRSSTESVHTRLPMPSSSLADDPRARDYRKLPKPVEVRFAEARGVIQTLEGPVGHEPGDAIITGPANDVWPVAKARFDTTYSPVAPTVAGTSGLYVRNPNVVRAIQSDAAFEVVTPAGAKLSGRSGDWLVEYAPGDQAIVSKEIFAETYALV